MKGNTVQQETAKGASAAPATKKAAAGKGTGNITLLALVMMNVTIVASIANDVQQSFYGLSSVTLFIVGAIVFFLPTGLVAAELASGWSERGGIFRWVGEGMGKGFAFSCLLILWFQTTFNFGSGIPSSTATIGFFTPDFEWAKDFAEHPSNELLIMCGWLVYYWVVCWVATKGVKWFAGIAKYGVLLGTFLPLTVMVILAVVWIMQGNKPAIEFTPSGLVPEWHGMATLALAAGVFFSFAGIDMNAAHVKQLKNPRKQFPQAIFIAMILCLLIFIIGTLIIATIIPEKDINVLYTLFAVYRELGSTIGMPWLYLVFVYLGLGASLAGLITNLAGPSYMLGQAGRSGFLPKILQNNNKHGMPSRLMYVQMAGMTAIAFLVFLLPNVEGFFILVTQSVTILYMLYYILMFISFLRLRYTQPNRPRTFVVPGGIVGAWVVAGVGLVACVFGVVLALYPPAQIKAEIGSGIVYVAIVLSLIALVILTCWGIYRLSRKRDWVDPENQFAPFTWELEGLKKPQKVLSNVPTEMMSEGQNPMGMPVKRLYSPDERIQLPPEYDDVKHRGDKGLVSVAGGSGAPGSAQSPGAFAALSTSSPAPTDGTAATSQSPEAPAPAAAPAIPDPHAVAVAQEAQKTAEEAEKMAAAAEAFAAEARADMELATAQQRADAAHTATEEAQKHLPSSPQDGTTDSDSDEAETSS